MGTKEEPSAVLNEIEKRYGILPLPSLEMGVAFSGDHTEALTLRRVLALGWKQLLGYSLALLDAEERKAKGPNKNRIAAKKKDWLGKGVGITLAAIALNPGLTFRWTSSGPVGDANWRIPSPQESEYWGWVHGLSRGKMDNNLVLSEIPHAVFIMRAMARNQTVTESVLGAFLNQINDLIGPQEDAPVNRGLQMVNDHFSRSLDRRRP